VLEREWLIERLWPDTFVEPNNLEQCVSSLRRMFGETAQKATYIRTVAGRGYCFSCPVEEVRPEPIFPVAPPLRVVDRHAKGVSLRWRPAWVAAVIVVALIAVLTTAGVWRGATPNVTAPRVLPVTSFPGLEDFPSISPDGNFVAFSWTGPQGEGAARDIWIKAVDSDDRRQLTSTPGSETSPAWSPDGREIAFVRAGAGRGIFIARVLGGQEQKVADSGTQVGWAPDGRSLLVRDAATRAQSFGIFRIDLGSGERSQITEAPSGIGDFTFDMSPDGAALAFVRFERPGVADVYVVRLADGTLQRRTDWNRPISRVVWTPDGNELVYAVNEVPALGQSLFRIPAFGTHPEHGERALHVEGLNPSISRPKPGQPARLAFNTRNYDVGLRLIDLQSPNVDGTIRAGTPFCDSSRVDFPGPFSKSADKVAFASNRHGWLQVFVANRDGSELRQVTKLEAVGLGIGGWSPDEHQLVIDAAIDGNTDMYAIRVADGRAVRLTTEPSIDGHGSWSSDGRWIYFSSNRTGRPEVWKVPSEGGQAVQLTYQGGIEPKESADGQSLYYLDRPPAGAGGFASPSTLKRVSVDGREETTILDNVRFGLWSVTSDGIVFIQPTAQHDELQFYGFQSPLRSLGRLPARVSRVFSGLSASHDGRWVLVNVTDQIVSDILVADGFR
jgi:Tol biopolymer transport system component